MRKIILVAAMATSALALSACGETADETADLDDAMVADTETNVDSMGTEVDEFGNDVDAVGTDLGDEADEAAMDAEAMMDE